MTKMAEQYYESAAMYWQAGEKVQAMQCLNRALLINPSYDVAWNNRGCYMKLMGHPFDAMMNFDRAIALNDGLPEYHQNKASSLLDLGQPAAALASLNKALAIKPDMPTALQNRGTAHLQLGHSADAMADFRAAVEADPQDPMGHLHLAFHLLRTGEFNEGWREFEWRWRTGQMPPRGMPVPPWQGENLGGKGIIVYSEQGLGDSLQFIRFCTTLRERYPTCTIYVEVRQALARLAKTVAGVDHVHIFGEPLPKGLDYCVAMMTLPLILGIDSEEDIPNTVPYFHIPQEAKDRWGKEFKRLMPINNKPYVGLCWAGMNRAHQQVASEVDAKRSVQLVEMAPVVRVPGINWISLQKGPPQEQLAQHAKDLGMLCGDWMDEADDFYDTAALIANLDLVITVDTSVAHAAAAMGVPTWILSRFDNCWRWMGTRQDSPWYPNVRQFIQKVPGQWEPVMLEVAEALREFAPRNLRKVA